MLFCFVSDCYEKIILLEHSNLFLYVINTNINQLLINIGIGVCFLLVLLLFCVNY